MSGPRINTAGIWAIYRTEMARMRRTIWQSVATPVITTMLYFIVFGGAIGSRIQHVGGVGYGAFIVPGLIMLSLLTQSVSNASIGIYFPKFTRTIFEILSAPLSFGEVTFAYVSAATTKSVLLAAIILATATLFVPVRILHPGWMVAFTLLTAIAFSLFGFIIGIWAENFEQLAIVPRFDRHTTDLPRRCLLHRRHAAAALADDQYGEPSRLSGQRISLEFLWCRRCRPGGQSHLHRPVHGAVRHCAVVDIPYRLSAEALIVADRRAMTGDVAPWIDGPACSPEHS